MSQIWRYVTGTHRGGSDGACLDDA
eukprot:COSAG01_NODE_51747_length_352_cov_0.822134_2_plen_24_part_01